METVAEARAATEKRLAAIHAEEAKQAAQAATELATRDSSPATAPQELFFTGKPYLEETGQYLFLFRHYDPELARWTTADPSGFPDGANNWRYSGNPLVEFDYQGLAIQTFASTSQGHAFWLTYSTYSYDSMTTDQVWRRAGGQLWDLHRTNPDFYNSCALRMHMTLYDYGYRFNENTPGVTPGLYSANYGTRYILSASGMRKYLDSGTSLFNAANSDRTLGPGAAGITQLIQDIEDLHSRTNRMVTAVLSDEWHVAVLTSSNIGYIDPHAFKWSEIHSPRVWVLE